MFYRIISVSALVVGLLGFSQVSQAEESVVEEAKIIVYRAGESTKTRRVGMYLHVNADSLGRLKANDSMVITQPAGEYTLGSSFKGTEPLVIDLKPGQTYYVHSDVQQRGNSIHVSFTEVEERVAKVQRPTLDSAI